MKTDFHRFSFEVIRDALKKVLPVIGGAALGFAYYYFIGCRTGTCPISCNPLISTLYGAAIGIIWALPLKKKNIEETK